MKISIIGTGQIGTDLLYKMLKIDYIKVVAFVGRRKLEFKTIPDSVFYSEDSIDYFISNPKCCDVVFDCTDAYSATINYKVFHEQNIKVIDLTPSKIGKPYIPYITPINSPNINMVTCGGQASIPLLKYFNNKLNIEYAEIITQISSGSAGLATRINIDKYIETTESAIIELVGIQKCKVILNINPSIHTIMQTTIYIKIYKDTDKSCLNDIEDYVNKSVRNYISNYKITTPVWLNDNLLIVQISVLGNGDVFSKYFGNLDIINCAAVHAITEMHRNNI